jgi:hypothetical protein
MPATKTKILITPDMVSAASRVWETIGPDCEAACAEGGGKPLKRLEKAEAILDADYMRTYGGVKGKEAADAFDALCADKSIKLDAVYKALADAMYL